jgi:protein TonB
VRYPARAARLGHEGTVVLRVHVGTKGAPIAVEVLSSSGHRSLDRAARAAVERWSFSPASRGGRPVAQWIRVPVRFALRSRS